MYFMLWLSVGLDRSCIGIKLVTVEFSCMAKGAQCCSFLISLPKDIEEQVKDILVAKGRNATEMNDILLLQQMKKQKYYSIIFND